jgi:hypothetical protein
MTREKWFVFNKIIRSPGSSVGFIRGKYAAWLLNNNLTSEDKSWLLKIGGIPGEAFTNIKTKAQFETIAFPFTANTNSLTIPLDYIDAKTNWYLFNIANSYWHYGNLPTTRLNALWLKDNLSAKISLWLEKICGIPAEELEALSAFYQKEKEQQYKSIQNIRRKKLAAIPLESRTKEIIIQYIENNLPFVFKDDIPQELQKDKDILQALSDNAEIHNLRLLKERTIKLEKGHKIPGSTHKPGVKNGGFVMRPAPMRNTSDGQHIHTLP